MWWVRASTASNLSRGTSAASTKRLLTCQNQSIAAVYAPQHVVSSNNNYSQQPCADVSPWQHGSILEACSTSAITTLG